MMLPANSTPIDQTLAQSQSMALQKRLTGRETKDDLMKTAKQFEGIFLQQLFTAMDKTVDRTEGFLDGGAAEETFRGMFYERVASSVSERPGASQFGIAAAIYKQLESQLPKDSGAQVSPGGLAHD